MPTRNMLIGIGNALHGDDGVGPLVAQEFSSPDWLCLDAGTAPENFTSVVRREQPDQVVLVDAAELGARPGEFRRVPKEKVRDVGLGTHMLPLSHLMTYLEEITPHIVFVGLQPRSLEDDAALSPEVRAGAARLMDLLQHNELEKIPIL